MNTTTPSKSRTLDIISEVMREAVADAIETHRRMGRSIVVGENGVVKYIRPRDIKPRALPGDEWEDQLDAG